MKPYTQLTEKELNRLYIAYKKDMGDKMQADLPIIEFYKKNHKELFNAKRN